VAGHPNSAYLLIMRLYQLRRFASQGKTNLRTYTGNGIREETCKQREVKQQQHWMTTSHSRHHHHHHRRRCRRRRHCDHNHHSHRQLHDQLFYGLLTLIDGGGWVWWVGVLIRAVVS
jgi:hypothetical protein